MLYLLTACSKELAAVLGPTLRMRFAEESMRMCEQFGKAL